PLPPPGHRPATAPRGPPPTGAPTGTRRPRRAPSPAGERRLASPAQRHHAGVVAVVAEVRHGPVAERLVQRDRLGLAVAALEEHPGAAGGACRLLHHGQHPAALAAPAHGPNGRPSLELGHPPPVAEASPA